jgi:hypothetical protein
MAAGSDGREESGWCRWSYIQINYNLTLPKKKMERIHNRFKKMRDER